MPGAMLITNRRSVALSNVVSPDETMEWRDREGVPPGWLPADVGAATVRWIRVNSQTPTDPFFDKWVAALRGRIPPPREHETDLASLAHLAAGLPEVEPAGIIFHVSRCGSTLLANALAAGENVFAIGEAPVFEKMMRLTARREPYSASAGAEALRALCRVFGHYRGPSGERLILKTGMGTVVTLRAIRSVWPSVPCVMLIRDPVEVVVSNFQTPPRALLEWYDAPAGCIAAPVPEEALGRGLEEFSAWLVGRICDAALVQMDDRCLLLDYRDLTPEAVLRVAEFFRLRLTDGEREALRKSFRFDAKRGGEFNADADKKKNAATAAMTEAVARWASAPYEALLHSHLRLRAG